MIDALAGWIGQHQPALVAVLAIAIIVLCAWTLSASVRLSRLQRTYNRLTRGTSGGNVEEILNEHLKAVEGVFGRLSAAEDALERHERNISTCLQRVGMVRFDAFEEVGGRQSFSLVVLDRCDSGFAVSGIYSRNDVRVYAKHIDNGRPCTPLSEEETAALEQARGSRAR